MEVPLMPEATRINLWGLVNAYLVREADGLTLIDTTLSQGAKRILAATRDLDAPIRRIALTHAHGDHIGALDRLHAELPEAEVIIGTRDARLLAKDKSLDSGEPQIKLRGGYPGAKTRPTRTVEDGEMVGSLRVIANPGHTPGHVAYLDERDRTLFCGDTFSTLGGTATSAKLNPRFPPIFMGTWSRAMVLESARALRALDPARLAPGHGRVVEDPGAEMDAAIARAS
jgi:glyoxylase-like metal-dependent hydrolase (beta-lactamase superfamily II)